MEINYKAIRQVVSKCKDKYYERDSNYTKEEYDNDVLGEIDALTTDVDAQDGHTWYEIADFLDQGNVGASKRICLHFFEKAANVFLEERSGYNLAITYLRMANDYDCLRGFENQGIHSDEKLVKQYEKQCFDYWGNSLQILDEMYGKDSEEYREALSYLGFILESHPDYYPVYESWLNMDSTNSEDVPFIEKIEKAYSDLVNRTGSWGFSNHTGYEHLDDDYRKRLKVIRAKLHGNVEQQIKTDPDICQSNKNENNFENMETKRNVGFVVRISHLIKKLFKSESPNTGNPFIAFCKSIITEGDTNKKFTFRDREFNVEVLPLKKFVIDYCRIDNNVENMKSMIQRFKKVPDDQWEDSLCRFAPTMEDLFTGSHPRFMIHIADTAFKVMCSDSMRPNMEHEATKELYMTIPKKYKFSAKVLCDVIQSLIDDPFSVTEKSDYTKRKELYTNEHLSDLENAFENAVSRIYFKVNPKFKSKDICYIGIGDMMSGSIAIRSCDGLSEIEENADLVVAKYSSLKELLLDDWMLD